MPLATKAIQWLNHEFIFFSYHHHILNQKWLNNPFNGISLPPLSKHWTDWDDFDTRLGDIKILWEPSRFNWLLDLSRAYRVSGEETYLDTINQWLGEWSKVNPLNVGPNWKCGQEVSIRLMKLITAALLLEQNEAPNKELIQMVKDHLSRIQPNIRYAIAQDNNHGTSEAAALYIGSAWLLYVHKEDLPNKIWIKWRKQGRKILEERLNYLVFKDGTFAQKSVNYHRVVVDTMSWALVHMRAIREPEFSESTLHKIKSLALWQYKMIVGNDGEAPNMGSNDGAMFEILHSCDYRDFRPSTQLIFALLENKKVFESGPWDEPLYWYLSDDFQLLPIKKPNLPEAEILDNQYVILRRNEATIFCILPHDKFRLASCDAFHLDLWIRGENILCDQGTYSYNAVDFTDKFKSTAYHNTIQVGNHEQMPKVSRFLYGRWLNAHYVGKPSYKEDSIFWEGAYTVKDMYEHHRKVQLGSNFLEVTDKVTSGSNESITVRWHSTFDLNNQVYCFENGEEPIKIDKAKHGCSHYYLEKHDVNVYSARTENNIIRTYISW
jgi:hypothetical protein